MDYTEKTRNELIEFCKENKIKGYSTKKKDELIQLIKDKLTPIIIEPATITTKRKKPQIVTSFNDIKAKKVYTNFDIVKPVIKWVGGKTQILEKVLDKFPKKIGDYYEPFLGGGSVLLGVLSYCKKGIISIDGKLYISDINPQLIALYKYIQNNIDEFIEKLQELVDKFNSINGVDVNRKPKTEEEAFTSQESYYYWVRQRFNELNKADKKDKKGIIKDAKKDSKKEITIESSVMLLFLNKTCFRGVYREGPNGFNVPFGHYKNPGIIDEEHLRNVSELLNEFKDKIAWNCCGFQESLGDAKWGLKEPKGELKESDFVYLDPPYAPETDTSFVGYTAEGFDIKLHQELFELCNKIKNKGTKLLMSNSDVKLLRDAFLKENGFTIEVVECRRAINSKNPESKTNEVLISVS